MNPQVASAAIAAGSDILSNVYNGILSNSANAKSKRAAASASIMQYVLQNQLIDKQNEYNKPINQMARLREAGLNPNLVYGDGGATIASAGGSVGSNMADITPASGSFNILGKMQTLKAMEQQDANIEETEARTQAIDDNIRLKEEELAFRRDFEERRLNVLEKQLANQTGRYDVQNAKTEAEKHYLENKFDASNPRDWIKLGMEAGSAVKNAFIQPNLNIIHKSFKKYRYER